MDIGFPTSSGSSPRLSYLGPVATRTGQLPTSKGSTGNNQMMVRTFHFARDNISALRIILPNFFVDTFNVQGGGNIEQGSGAAAAVTASIEYPAGTFTKVLFSASASGTIANNSILTSDQVSVTIPNGAMFWVRWWGNFPGANGIPYANNTPTFAANGDAMTFGATVTDQTMGGTVANTSANRIVFPCAILGMTTRPSFLFIHDSKGFGQNDTAEYSGDIGQLARSIGPNYAYLAACAPGDTLASLATAVGSTNRRALWAYGTHVILGAGVNDLRVGTATATCLTNQQTIISAAVTAAGGSVRPLWTLTITPVSTSTDSWVTPVPPAVSGGTGNQTTNANNANINTFNDAQRAGVAGAAGFIEISDVQSTYRNSGIWSVPSGLAISVDGLHENQRGYKRIAASGAVNGAIGIVV